jgi:threonine/homoserine/homoserine lactone efflux protein
MAEPGTKKSLTDGWRDDPIPLFGGFVACLILAAAAAFVLHGRAAEAVGTPLMFIGVAFLFACAWFGVSGYRRRTGRSRSR